MDRGTLQRHRADLVSTDRPPELTTATGGSTGEPIQVGKWHSESRVAAGDLWSARGWFGVAPHDRLFLLWGHSHLLGTGLSGFAQRTLRTAKDAALGYRRHSAYDLSREGLRGAGRALIAHRPAWVLGYAAALDRFARVNADRAGTFAQLGLEVAVATGESFPASDSRERLAGVLGCPVAMEYGTVETGPLAHEHPEDGWRTFWQHWHLEADPESGEAIVTALFPRATPLIRYRLGDLLGAEDLTPPLLSLDRVVGRANATLVLDDGAPIHSEAFSHAFREEPVIEAFQVRGLTGGQIEMRYLGPRALDMTELERVRGRLAKIHPRLAKIELRHAERLPQTVAGKTLQVIREPEHAGSMEECDE